MADQTAIEWCDSTFNGWIGCTRVSPACDHCYAAVSTPARTLGIEWGAGQPRRRTSPANWKLPLRWNAEPFVQCMGCGWRGEGRACHTVQNPVGFHPPIAAARVCPACMEPLLEEARRRVFCSSLADVFDNEVDLQWRADLFALIQATPNLDWLLLTKRIGNVPMMVSVIPGWMPSNVWLGATICNQAEADRDIPKLLKVPAAVRFLSIEPMLGRVDLCEALGMWWNQTMGCFEGVGQRINVMPNGQPGIGWVIAGGESGTEARHMHPSWVRALRDQCAAAGVPFLFKQWGEWAPIDGAHHFSEEIADRAGYGGWQSAMQRVGKKAAGRTLDGATHTEFPEVAR
jgi:protein gp37